MSAQPQRKIQPDTSPDNATPASPDIPALMAEIRAKVKRSIEGGALKRTPFVPSSPPPDQRERRAGELAHSEELRYLNQNYAFPLQQANFEGITSHRPLIGRLIVKLKRKLLTVLWDNLFKQYVNTEKEYFASLVRYLNDTSKYVDSRDTAIFRQLVDKIDSDVRRAVERLERSDDDLRASVMNAEKRFQEGLHFPGELLARLENVEGVARGLERLLGQWAPANSLDNASDTTPALQSSAPAPTVDLRYLLIENRYRGSEESIAERLSIYPPLFKGATSPVLEIGVGRGELQALFKQAHIPSYGIDIDAAMVEATTAKGFDARHADAIAHLSALPDRSIGGVIAVQVIEHLTRDTLCQLLKLCKQKIASGGIVVFETINSESIVALTQNYFRDPTHVWPLHPETMRYLVELQGLEVLEVRKLSPFPEGALLKKIDLENLTPRPALAMRKLNDNIERLNQLLYGFQDYCIIAKVH